MGLPTLSRGIGFRDDEVDNAVTQQNAASVSGVTVSSDGDLLTWSGTFTNPTVGDGAIVYRAVSSLASSTYTVNIVRAKITALTGNFIVTAYTHFTDTTTQVNTVTIVGNGTTTSFNAPVTTEPAGKTIDRIGVIVSAQSTQAGTFTFTVLVDFVLLFKENLTLPTAIRPLSEQDVSIMPVIPVLGRQGGLVQYIGAMSPRYTIAGGLVNTTSGQSGWTQTYTADQWWQVLKGVWIEQNTLQADGNPTWQYLTSDNITGKVLLSYGPQQVPGRVAYHEYVLTLTEFDINGLSTANLPGITY